LLDTLIQALTFILTLTGMGRNQPNRKLLLKIQASKFLLTMVSAPLEELEPHIRKLWDRELDDIQILNRLKEERLFDTEKYGLG
jgi:CRISPR/Cas system-associated endoribonuclease Cas2